jgi:ubiquinone/menaquinone biosynthesis C-methylase UbiE
MSETFEIGSNWVRNPHRVLAEIEREFDLTAEGYEARSAEWDYRGATDGPAFAARHLPAGARILDAGCGTGLIGAGLHALGWEDLAGADISAGMLARARARGIYRTLAKCDLCAMPFEDASFDAVVCIAVLTYAPSLERTFSEFERVLRPGGLLVFSHRVDLEADCGFDEALARRLPTGAWTTLEVTAPMLYYPNKPDYAAVVTVRYHAYRY